MKFYGWIRLPFRDYKPLLTICVLIGILILAVSIVGSVWPRYEESFFEVGLLGKDKKAENFYPTNSSSIEVGSNTTWYIYIHNHMKSSQSISIRVKLLNLTMLTPDDRKHEPSPYPFFAEIPLSLDTEETLNIPFQWSVLEASYLNGSVVIRRLMVNNQSVEVNVSTSSLSEARFRIVFELWIYDENSGQYRFWWESNNELYSASIYIWFNLS
jgi:hypothetical protein